MKIYVIEYLGCCNAKELILYILRMAGNSIWDIVILESDGLQNIYLSYNNMYGLVCL